MIFTTSFFFFFNDTATTEIYTLSLHDALPICPVPGWTCLRRQASRSEHDRVGCSTCANLAQKTRASPIGPRQRISRLPGFRAWLCPGDDAGGYELVCHECCLPNQQTPRFR